MITCANKYIFKIPRLYQSVDMDLDMIDLVKSVLNKKMLW